MGTTGESALQGRIEKMVVAAGEVVQYELPVGDERLGMNALVGQRVTIEWTGTIECIHCGRVTKKSFQQGYCFPCMKSLARCDQCVVKPELCHYDQGTCREPEWGEAHCLIPHTVYLANSSGLKVGITRGLDPTTRWIDQGASEALPVRIVPNRLSSGDLEVSMKGLVADKTNWRRMLEGAPEPVDLAAERDRLFAELAEARPDYEPPGEPAEAEVTRFEYPVLAYPEKVVSHNLDKKPRLEGTLTGIKGQYLLLDTAVINMRKYAGYVLEVVAP